MIKKNRRPCVLSGLEADPVVEQSSLQGRAAKSACPVASRRDWYGEADHPARILAGDSSVAKTHGLLFLV